MSKFHLKEQAEAFKTIPNYPFDVFEAYQAEERTEIETPAGVALVEPGTYVVTSPDGSLTAVAETDFHNKYVEAGQGE